jgi:hypothetical protein
VHHQVFSIFKEWILILMKNLKTGFTGSTGFFPGFPEESLETASPSARLAYFALLV